MKACLPPICDRRRQEKKRILVADANALLRGFLEHVLARQGYEVLLAADGDRALHLISSGRPDLVILDLMLPGIGGFELLRLIRDTPAFAGTPAFVVSDRASEEDIVGAFRLGASDYLVKPFIRGELTIRIKRILYDRAVKGEAEKTSSHSPKSEFDRHTRAASSDLLWSEAAKIEIEKERLALVRPRLKLSSQTRSEPTEGARGRRVTLRRFTQASEPTETARWRRVTLRKFTQALIGASFAKS